MNPQFVNSFNLQNPTFNIPKIDYIQDLATLPALIIH